ncbi:MAG: YesL family protein [Lachnospiraceae bacterium]
MRFLSPDSGFMRGLSTVSDVFLISFLWIMCSLPVVTIGPASCAAYYALIKVVHKKKGYLSKEFFKSFRLNLKQGLFLSVIVVVLLALLGYNIYTMYWAMDYEVKNNLSGYSFYLLFAYFVILLLVIAFMLYAFPAMSRFTFRNMQITRFAVFALFRHMLSTLAMLVVFVASVILLIVFPMAILFVPAGNLYLQSVLVERILRRYMSEEQLAQWDGTNEEIYTE